MVKRHEVYLLRINLLVRHLLLPGTRWRSHLIIRSLLTDCFPALTMTAFNEILSRNEYICRFS